MVHKNKHRPAVSVDRRKTVYKYPDSRRDYRGAAPAMEKLVPTDSPNGRATTHDVATPRTALLLRVAMVVIGIALMTLVSIWMGVDNF
jgi:hypothetical protein